jgi:hypothetical protein
MSLSAPDLLTTIVATFLSSYSGRFDRLAIHYAGAGLKISLQANPQTLPDIPVDLLPATVDVPLPKVMKSGGPRRKVVRKHAPLAAASQDEDGV